MISNNASTSFVTTLRNHSRCVLPTTCIDTNMRTLIESWWLCMLLTLLKFCRSWFQLTDAALRQKDGPCNQLGMDLLPTQGQ